MKQDKFYPLITPTHVIWTKAAIDSIDFKIEDIEPSEMVITLDLAEKAVRMLDLNYKKDSEGEVIYDLSAIEFLHSDLFINSPKNQKAVLNFVKNSLIKWN